MPIAISTTGQTYFQSSTSPNKALKRKKGTERYEPEAEHITQPVLARRLGMGGNRLAGLLLGNGDPEDEVGEEAGTPGEHEDDERDPDQNRVDAEVASEPPPATPPMMRSWWLRRKRCCGSFAGAASAGATSFSGTASS